MKPLRGPLSVERLESRVLFDVTPMLTTGGVPFTGGQKDNLYLKTVDGVLQWSTDGTTYSSNLAPTGSSPQTLTLGCDTTVNVNVGGIPHLESMTGAAGTFESTSALVVDPGVILSSQVLDSNGNVIANAQWLSLVAPVITLDVGAQIQAGASGIFKGGQIKLLASDTETSATAQGNAQVNITSASVTGSDIFIEATSSLNASAALPLDVPGASVRRDRRRLAGACLHCRHHTNHRHRQRDAFTAQAISGVGNASKVGVAGALAVNVVNNSSTASIQPGATVAVGGANVNLVTNNKATESATAKPSGLGASGGSLGVGAAVALNLATNTTKAVVGDNAVLSNAGSLSLNATSMDTVTTLADAGATGGRR